MRTFTSHRNSGTGAGLVPARSVPRRTPSHHPLFGEGGAAQSLTAVGFIPFHVTCDTLFTNTYIGSIVHIGDNIRGIERVYIRVKIQGGDMTWCHRPAPAVRQGCAPAMPVPRRTPSLHPLFGEGGTAQSVEFYRLLPYRTTCTTFFYISIYIENKKNKIINRNSIYIIDIFKEGGMARWYSPGSPGCAPARCWGTEQSPRNARQIDRNDPSRGFCLVSGYLPRKALPTPGRGLQIQLREYQQFNHERRA